MVGPFSNVRNVPAGATDVDTQLAVLIASAFCMYNRMVDGLRARTPPSPEAYRDRAKEIADYGYVLHLGAMRTEGTAAELNQSEALKEAYLGAGRG